MTSTAPRPEIEAIDTTIKLLNDMLTEKERDKPLDVETRLKITDRLLKAYALKNKLQPDEDETGGRFNRGK